MNACLDLMMFDGASWSDDILERVVKERDIDVHFSLVDSSIRRIIVVLISCLCSSFLSIAIQVRILLLLIDLTAEIDAGF